MPVPHSLTNFNVAEADVSVWLFRRSGKSDNPVFTGHWIETDDALDVALRAAVSHARDGIVEASDFDILAEIGPEQALLIDTEVTHATQIVEKAADQLPAKRASTVAHMQNTDFYVIKLTHGDEVLHAVRKTDDSWTTRQTRSRIHVVFSGDQLGLEEDPSFTLSRYVDLFIVGDDTIILNKKNFETILSYKQAHADDFALLQAEPAFSDTFTDLAALIAYVGTNTLHLRRLSAIRQKGHYQDAIFMGNLRQNHGQAGLNLTFDNAGKIVPNAAQCPDIIRALLNHRLYSLFSQGYFDVQSTTPV